MNDLAEVLRAQAAASRPRSDLDDALRRARARRKRVVGLRAVAAMIVVLAVASGVVVTQRDDGDRAVVAGASPGLPALVIGAPPGRRTRSAGQRR